MDSNRDDAERCLSLASAALAAGDLTRASRLQAKSVRMYSADAKLAAAQATVARKIGAATPEPVRQPSPEMTSVVRRVNTADGHYAVLGVEKSAPDTDVRKAFRRLALALHPDKNIAPGAEEAFKKVSTASEVLSDGDRRRMYDQFGVDDAADMGSRFGAGGGGAGPSRNARRRKQTQQRRPAGRGHTLEDELDDLMSSMSPEEVFEFLFSAAGGAGGVPRGPGGGSAFHSFNLFDGGRVQQQHGAGAGQSMWTRYKPLTLLATLFLMLMLLSGGGAQDQYSLFPTTSLNVRSSTTCGVDFYVSSYFSLPDPKRLESLHDAVNIAAVEAFERACQDERARRDELRRMSTAWLSLASTKARYAEMARNYHMPNCRNSKELIDRIRIERDRRREQSRNTGRVKRP
jgi:DnaJ homolog subfamily B member 12